MAAETSSSTDTLGAHDHGVNSSGVPCSSAVLFAYASAPRILSSMKSQAALSSEVGVARSMAPATGTVVSTMTSGLAFAHSMRNPSRSLSLAIATTTARGSAGKTSPTVSKNACADSTVCAPSATTAHSTSIALALRSRTSKSSLHARPFIGGNTVSKHPGDTAFSSPIRMVSSLILSHGTPPSVSSGPCPPPHRMNSITRSALTAFSR